MKKDLLTLIDSIDEIEKLFHTVGGNGMPTVDTIYDIQAFQDWFQEVHLELRDIHDRKRPASDLGPCHPADLQFVQHRQHLLMSGL